MEAKEILNEALKNVKQEILIKMDNDYYLVYIMDCVYRDGEIELSLATPNEVDEYTKDRLYQCAYDAVLTQLKEGQECQSKGLFSRICSLMKSIFVKFSRS